MIKKTLVSILTFLIIPFTWGQIYIEAESYSSMEGVETQGTSDVGGGLNVGYIDDDDWMEYVVSIPMAGDYKLQLRAASANGGGIIGFNVKEIELATMTVDATGDWQNWETMISPESIALEKGEQTIRLTANKGGLNLNWFALALSNPIDTDKPSAPVVISKSEDVHGGKLTWSKATDATSVVVGYKILDGARLLGISNDTTIELIGLPANKTLNVGVVAVDLAGNVSDTGKTIFTTKDYPWDLQWSDEFDYSGKPDDKKWYFETGGDGWGNGEAQYYTNGDNSNVEDGALVIEVRKETYESNEFTSSRMNSTEAMDFLYGRIEIKAKLPKTKGSWPAIWTLPTDWIYGGWPACGEIDIMEHSILTGYGNVFGTVHTGSYNHQDGTQQSGGVQLDDVTDAWHIYAIEWYPDHIDWYVDDHHIFRFDNEYKTTDEWPYDIKHHLLLNVAVGGGLGGDIDMNGEWPQRMYVDYVRVYDFKLGENDTIAPQPISGLAAEVNGTMVDLSWNSASDNHAIKEYHVLKDGQAYDTTKNTNYLMAGLLPETEYLLSVLATDYSDNKSSAVSTTVVTAFDKGIEVPGRVEAEDYVLMEGVQTEACEDEDGGFNVGYIDGGDWMTYVIDVTEAKEYRAGFRVASEGAVGDLVLGLDDDILASVETPITGGWQVWETVLSEPFILEKGIHTIKVSTEQGGFNLNYIDLKGTDDFVGVDELGAGQLLIYPNPSHGGELTIVLPAGAEESDLLVTTIEGKIVLQHTANGNELLKIDSQNWLSGVYLVSVTTAHKVYSQKIYKQ